MSLYQIVEIAENNNTAGTKAVQDVATIAAKYGFTPVEIKVHANGSSIYKKVKRQLGFWKEWNTAYHQIESNAIVLLQHPFRIKQLSRATNLKKLKCKKKAKIISLVHDVEELRHLCYNSYYKHEFDVMMEVSDILIVHNKAMANFFKEKGAPEEKIIILEIFDYLQDDSQKNKPTFSKQITIAGNLDIKKCAYIGQLPQIKGIEIQLYGPNFESEMEKYENIHYGGSILPNKIPEKLTKGFGLVWDGTSIEGCEGDAGQYLRYNNPHKLSLYLSSNLPVVIWSGAAEAKFVEKNKVGITTDSLIDLSNKFATLSKEDYDNFQKNTEKLAVKLKKGYFTEHALKTAVERIEKH